MFNYSIIIPHKNIPSLLRRCLNSIPNRPDLEIIVVDDNSNEETIKDLKSIHRNNLQIIYTKEGKGAGYARNVGINNAQGKWILFADADDLFISNAFGILDKHKDSRYALIIFKSRCRNSDKLTEIGKRQNICDSISGKINDFQNGKIGYVELLLGSGVPWAKMINHNFIKENNIYFEEVRYSNDVGWNTQIALKINNNVSVSNEEIYCWTDRSSSLYYTRNKDAFFCRFNVYYRQHLLLTASNLPSIFNFCHFVDAAREFGILFLLKFYRTIFKEGYVISPVYQFEKKLNLKAPYCYLFVQFVKSIFDILFFFAPHKKKKIKF